MEMKFMATAGTLSLKGGVFTGVANRANYRDYGDDVVESMAWTKGESPMSVPLLAQHEAKDVIGRAALREDPEIGLVITKGEFADGVTLAEDYKRLVAGGFIDGVSVGYSVIDGFMGRDGARHLTALKLHEVSIVTFPMNALSRVTSISDAKQLEAVVAAIRATRLRMVSRHEADESAASKLAALLRGMKEEAGVGSLLSQIKRMRKEVGR
jgi:HK97 family phage prohead protease